MDSASEARLREAIRRYFRELKPQEADLVADELIRRGSMGELLAAIDLPDPGYSDDQYASLLNYIRREGFAAFVFKIQSGVTPPRRLRRSSGEDVASGESKSTVSPLEDVVLLKRREAAKAPVVPRAGSTGKPSTPDNLADTSGTDIGHGIRRVRASLPEIEKPEEEQKSSSRKSDTGTGGMSDTGGKKMYGFGFSRKALTPAGASSEQVAKLGSAESDSSAKATGAKKSSSGEWNGVERRSGKERRVAPDRRDSVEVIFKNKRYGKDRRSGQDRRRKK
ncbi:MAG: hypothetical protein PWP23_2186 [Candidatus Sumerlaeota bacterium]|nr:hypothetical protein [Candidatus Sumerlaeota bacterium]